MPWSKRVGPLGSIVLVLCLVSATVAGSADGVAASPESPSAGSTTTESVAAAATAVFAASASVTPRAQYLGETGGRVFTFTIANTGSRDGIGAVAINRPGKFWTIKKCPKAPAGWTKVRSRTSCRYRSAASRADDIAPGATSSAFRVRAANRAGDHNITGAWPVVVSRSNGFDTASRRTAGTALPGGLPIAAYSFQVLRVVIDPGTTRPGAACPTSTNKTAVAGSVGHTFVVCGRNRTNRTLTPIADRSSLGGTFVAGHGGFHSGPVAPSGTARILGSWTAVTITAAAGTNKTVVARIGSARNRTSPLTTLSGYRATVGVNVPPVAVNDATTMAEDNPGATINVLANDTDANADTLSVAALDTTGTVGQVTNNGTNVSYDPNGAFDALGSGDTATDTFGYTVSDGHGGTDTATDLPHQKGSRLGG